MNLVQRIFEKFTTFKGDSTEFQWFQYHTRKSNSISMQKKRWMKQYDTFLISKEIGKHGNIHFHVVARSSTSPVFSSADNTIWTHDFHVPKSNINVGGSSLIFMQHFKKHMALLGELESQGLTTDLDHMVNDDSYISEYLYEPFMRDCSDLWVAEKKSKEQRDYLLNQIRYTLKDIHGCLIPNVNVILGRGTKYYVCADGKVFI